MKIVHPKYFDAITITDENPETLVIENALYFRQTISSIINQMETNIGDYVVSVDNEPVSMQKTCLLITDIYNFYQNDKRLKTKIQQMIVNEAQFSDKQFRLISDLNEFAINISNSVQYPVSFKEDITIADIV